MLRVLLIDDEPLALEGLKLLIDWRAEGFEICGECADACTALKMLRCANPDLIVTDIRMPEMSGLELLCAARQAGFDGQFVIVSGYSDFYYAKQALQLGVAGYLIKPIEPADAATVLAHVRRKLIDKETEVNTRQKAIHRAINEMLAKDSAPDEIIPGTKRWILATWGSPLSYPIVQELLSLFTGDEATVHILEDKEYLVLRANDNAETPDLNQVHTLLKQHNRTLTTGPAADNAADLYTIRKQLSDQLDNMCRLELIGHVDRLVNVVARRQADECVVRCIQLESFCASCGTKATIYARRQLISACSGLLKGRSDALDVLLRSQGESFRTLCELTIELLQPEKERISDRMERYVQEHPGECFTLSGVAEALKYNATYLGRKFNEERGIGFREWLIQLRMDESAKLLRNTTKSVNAIAKTVGYDYYRRFLKHFKQHYGITPEQYRKLKR